MLKGKRAVVLYSGGVDSTALLALSRWEYEQVFAISFSYGQRHGVELVRARAICDAAGIPQHTVSIDPFAWQGHPLAAGGSGLEQGRSVQEIAHGGVPRSFLPGRNLLFLTHAIAYAGSLGGADVLIGATWTDASGFPDCSEATIVAMREVARLALPEACPVRVLAPFVRMTKGMVMALGGNLGVDFSRTWTCYAPVTESSGAVPCGVCDSCVVLAAAVTEAAFWDRVNP